MKQFRLDNTEGYNDDELAELNATWDRIVAAAPVDEDEDKSMLDHWAETLLASFDAGKRGDGLLLDWAERMLAEFDAANGIVPPRKGSL